MMEAIKCKLSAEDFDSQVHHAKALPEGGDLAIYVKPNATEGGNAVAVITFSVQLPDGSPAVAQAVTTVNALLMALSCLKGWKEGGHLV